ncbi:hypothetical protein CTI12_AA508270 [Artemisia annua]|uniref:Bifunctional inhibitor/plant lipid transfer protein/seed storage helical domain-containing protein n=1 Tax=Artemisia annua TaxID=35608 RepID=A0A2U1LBT8_ARTAN|nr:hypothetical protein CTI12_AA508270 [Artemisia annua]
MSSVTATLSPLSQTIELCGTSLNDLTNCFDYLGYLGKGTRMREHPSSSCCSVLRDAWKIDPECVSFKVLDGVIFQNFWDFNTDTTRLDHLSATCGIGSSKSNPPSQPPVAFLY